MKLSNNKKAFLILLLVVLGQTMAFDDEVEQERINNQSATYVADHLNEIGE